LQAELVHRQITRVQQWSDGNDRATKPGVVTNWSLSIRKREQKRLEDRKESGKKRGYANESDDDALDGAMLNGTAVPEWLLEKCGTGYSTEQMLEIVDRLRSEIDMGKLSQIPDIEILPNISSDGEDGKPKTYLKRKTSGTGNTHKRSQSMGVALRPESLPMARRISQPNNYWAAPEHHMDALPVEKRQRIADMDNYYSERQGLPALQRPSDRAMPPALRRTYHLPHRPAFASVREDRPEESYFANTRQPANGMPHFVFGAGAPQSGPLPAPTPQRRPSGSVASHLESSSSVHNYHHDPRRPMHQRSHSDVSAFSNGPVPSYRPSSSTGYGAPPMGYNNEQHEGYDPGYTPRQDSSFNSGPPGYYDELPPRQYSYNHGQFQQTAEGPYSGPIGPNRHSRHQSTPNAGRMMHRTPSQGFNPLPMVHRQGEVFEHPPPPVPNHSRRTSYAGPVPQQPRIMEDDGVKNLFGARR
jgi:hypothetical protein